jgi:hypothetical protein
VDDADCARIVERRLGIAGAELATVARTLAAEARQFGNLNFVVSVCRRAKRLAKKEAVAVDHISRAISSEKCRR